MDDKRTYQIALDVESIEGLDAVAGTEIICVWKYGQEISVSHTTEVWDDPTTCGVAYFDARWTRVCTMTRRLDAYAWRSKGCRVEIQALPVEDSPKHYESSDIKTFKQGVVLATCNIDLADFCSVDRSSREGSLSERIQVELKPRGTLTARVSTQWIETEDFEEEFSDAFNEPVSVRSLSASNGDGAQSCVESQNCPTSIIPGGEYAAIYESVAAVAGEKTISSEIEIESDGFLTAHQPFPNTERSQMVSSAHSFSETSSCNPSTSLTTGASSEAMPLGSSSSALMRRCKRLEKQRDEARAEAFAQASVAVQRGIEIENLKRAKEMLMKRLETTELQLMGINRGDTDATSEQTNHTDDTDSEPSTSKKKESERPCSDDCSASQDRSQCESESSVLAALVEAKLHLAEREFEVMALQGQLRARETHIEMLTDHLAAIRKQAEEKQRAQTSITKLHNSEQRSCQDSQGTNDDGNSSLHSRQHRGSFDRFHATDSNKSFSVNVLHSDGEESSEEPNNGGESVDSVDTNKQTAPNPKGKEDTNFKSGIFHFVVHAGT